MAILEDIRQAAQKRFLFLPHAVRQMSRPARMISAAEVETVALRGELIEDYPNDPRGIVAFCWVWATVTGRCTSCARRKTITWL
jgi:hypothetical protein